jgi:DNA-directed RNA polymerase beta' subunit
MSNIPSKKEKKFYTSYSKLSEVKLITIGLASPERIKQWAEKTLPNGKILGEVINANTLHHKTFKPQKGGLFCERIFGPLKDFECACGKPLKYKKNTPLKETSIKSVELNPNKSILGEIATKTRNFCNTCEVEYTWSVMRRYQLGYIKLISPVTHVWYLKGNPSYLSILLDIKKRHLEYITYCSETLTIENALKGGTASSKSSDIVSSWNKLKQKIMVEKTPNLNGLKNIKLNISATSCRHKIEKRQKVKLKKYKYWKQFYGDNQNIINTNRNETNNGFISSNIKKSPKDWYNFLVGPAIQLKFFKELKEPAKILHNNNKKSASVLLSADSSKKQFIPPILPWRGKEIKTYARKIDLKKLTTLKIIISQAKQTKLSFKGSLEALISINGSAKQIFKKIAIPFYILLNLNKTQKSLSNNVIDTVWQKLSAKALKKALIRVNKIFNKIDSISFTKNWVDGLTNIETLNLSNKVRLSRGEEGGMKRDISVTDKIIFSATAKKKLAVANNNSLKKLLYQVPFTISPILPLPLPPYPPLRGGGDYKEGQESIGEDKLLTLSLPFAPLKKEGVQNKELYSEPLLAISKNSSFKYLRYCVKSIKNYFYSLLNYYLPNTKFKKKLISPYFKGKINSQDLHIKQKNKEFSLFFKSKEYSLFYLEFYTLSNFASPLIQFIISDYVSRNALNFKKLKKTYKTILKNLSEIFFKIILKNAGYSLKAIACTKNIMAPDTKVSRNNSENKLVVLNKKDKINKKDFQEFKNSLKIFYSVANINCSAINIKKAVSLSPPYLSTYFPSTAFSSPYSHKSGRGAEGEYGEIRGQVRLSSTQKLKKGPSLKMSEEKEQDTFVTPKKKLYNNIYCLSHRERWEVENDWNFLYYFISAPFLGGQIIPNYKDRFENGYGTNFAAREYDATLTYQNISFNLQKSAYFSGPGIVQQLLNEFNFYEIKKMDKQNRILLYQLNKQIFKLKKHAKRDRSAKKELKESYKKRDLLIRRTKLVRKLFIKESAPQATILTILPVLPPDLRPIVKIGGQIAASDLNRLYQRVIYRNDRLKKFLKDPATSHSYEMKYAQRLLQEAVDNLIQNGKSGVVSEKDSRGRALKSLSDILKGKQGRFRQYLLGKRVDYSGRSVIVVGPKLKLHECGIPKEMALELYLPFLLKRILNEKLARTVVGAKTLIKTNPSLIWELLREIMQTCPVLLNRAPTLHRLGIQAFQPKLIDGRAILLHPLVCSAFNADFDGDQMAVHVPITVEARAEAWKLMLSRNNILSPATGDPLAIPSQDMVLGCYYLTTNLLNSKTHNFAHRKGSGSYFSNIDDALKNYELNKIDLHANIWLKWNGFIENGSDQEEPIEIRIDSYGNWKEIYNKSQKSYNYKNNRSAEYILTTPGKILFNQIIKKSLNFKGFKY